MIAQLSILYIVGLVVAFLILAVLLLALRQMVNIVQQGQVGVLKRLGEYRATHEPGLVIIAPFIDSLQRVDMREIPVPGDRQDVITRDNVVVTVNATIFTQVVDAQQALFSVKNFDIAIDALARTALRSVIGTMTLDDALSERERINTDVQQQMEVVTDKWGIRISRIEIVEIAPPPQILQALALQKQADQEKRATILTSEGTQMSAINVAEGAAQAAVRAAQGERQAAILRAEGNRQAAILESEGRAQAIATVYGAIKQADPDPTLVAILQLDALARFADSDNTKIMVPFESAALMGAAQALRSVLDAAPVRSVAARRSAQAVDVQPGQLFADPLRRGSAERREPAERGQHTVEHGPHHDLRVELRVEHALVDPGPDDRVPEPARRLAVLLDVGQAGDLLDLLHVVAQDAGHVRVLGHALDPSGHQRVHGPDGVGLGVHHLVVPGQLPLAVVAQDLLHHLVLRFEVVVEAARQDPGLVGDVSDRGPLDPLLGEDAGRDLQDLVAPRRRAGPGPRARRVGRHAGCSSSIGATQRNRVCWDTGASAWLRRSPSRVSVGAYVDRSGCRDHDDTRVSSAGGS